MIKTRKRILCAVLSMLLVFSLCTTALAADREVVTVDTSGQAVLSREDAAPYSRYLLQTSGEAWSDAASSAITADDILSWSRELSVEECGGLRCATYEAKIPEQLLPDNSKVTGVSALDKIVYVQYAAGDGADVTISYDSDGFHDMFVYYPDTDKGVYISAGSRMEYSNFRYGCLEVMREDEAARKVEGAAPLAAGGAAKSNFANTDAMLRDLKKSFPERNTTESFTRFCSALGANRGVKVNGFRGSYRLTSANYRLFAVSTAITVIAFFLGGETIIAVKILTALGVGISLNGLICDQVKLYATGNFTYTGIKTGLVYDTTVYNDYVYVKRYSDQGTFAGGYDAQGVFRWVENNRSSAWHMTGSSVATAAMEAYNWDVALNGRTSYNTVGFW